MGLLDRLFGRPEASSAPIPRTGAVTAYPPRRAGQAADGPQDSRTGATAHDQAAIARYRYLLRTAPPERIEQVHAEAFARLTPQQRQAVLAELTRTLPAEELPRTDDPGALARAATRAEVSRPGYMQNTFGRPGMGMGGIFAGSMLGTIAGVVVGSAVADMLLGGFEQSPEAAEASGAEGAEGAEGASGADSADASGAESGDTATDPGADVAAGDWGSADAGGSGWDLGGGDFGGDFF